MDILLTTTSFQDTPGKHHKKLDSYGFNIITKRGPLCENEMLELIENVDALICGDDHITHKVIKKGKNSKLKVISKYGTGLDRIDLKSAKSFKIPVFNCPGVNKNTVAEHVFAMLLTYIKNMNIQINDTRKGEWNRRIGNELRNKKIFIIGYGNIGKVVSKISIAFGMKVFIYDKFINKSDDKDLIFLNNIDDGFKICDIISLHVPSNKQTKRMINKKSLSLMKKCPIIVNTSRGNLIIENEIIDALKNKIIKAYLTDVLTIEPMQKNHIFKNNNDIQITPHIGSRTYENVEKQAIQTIKNLTDYLKI